MPTIRSRANVLCIWTMTSVIMTSTAVITWANRLRGPATTTSFTFASRRQQATPHTYIRPCTGVLRTRSLTERFVCAASPVSTRLPRPRAIPCMIVLDSDCIRSWRTVIHTISATMTCSLPFTGVPRGPTITTRYTDVPEEIVQML